MKYKAIWIYFSALALTALAVFAAGIFSDEAVAEAVYAGDNAFGTMYEAVGKIPAFAVLAIAACVLALRPLRTDGLSRAAAVFIKCRRAAYAVLALLACILAFKDAMEVLSDSTAVVGAACCALGCVSAALVYVGVSGVSQEKRADLEKWAVTAVAAVLIAALAVVVLKEIWGRPRFADVKSGAAEFVPWYSIAGAEGGDSMPSGHAAFGSFTFFILSLVSFSGSAKKIAFAACICAAFTLLTMAARITDGHHYLSDVGAGCLVSVIIQGAALLISFGPKLEKLRFGEKNIIGRLC